MALVGSSYFMQGTSTLLHLSTLSYMKDYLDLTPFKTQMMTSLIATASTLKILFAFISDSYSLFGSRKRYYLLSLASLLVSVLVMIWFGLFEGLTLFVCAMFLV